MHKSHDDQLVEIGTNRLLEIGWPDNEKYNDASRVIAREKAEEMFRVALVVITQYGKEVDE